MGREWRIEDGRWRISILYPPSSILELNCLPDSPAARAREVKLKIVSLGIEHINGIATVAFHAAMKLADRFGGLQCLVVIFPSHIERLVKNTVLIQRVALDGCRSFEQNDIIIAAAQTVEFLHDAANPARHQDYLDCHRHGRDTPCRVF